MPRAELERYIRHSGIYGDVPPEFRRNETKRLLQEAVELLDRCEGQVDIDDFL